MLPVNLVNPADGIKQLVEPARSALVAVRPVPPFGADLDAVVFRSFLTDVNGSSDMTVLASPAAPVVFSIRAQPGADLYIKSIAFLITGTSMNLGFFGDQPPLTDPCILTYDTETSRVILSDDITANFDLIRLGGEPMPGVGSVETPSPPDALKVGSPALGQSTNDAYVAFIDFSRVYGFPWGVRLEADSEQRFDFLIQDDLTLVTSFDCTVYGFLRGPDTERS